MSVLCKMLTFAAYFCRRHKREAAAEAIHRPRPRNQAEAAAPGAAEERPAPPAYEEVCLEIAEEASDNHFLALNDVRTAPVFPHRSPLRPTTNLWLFHPRRLDGALL